ncbi:hypothetical protein BE20_00550 [Sorangium cellulosum]|nr:hypothetical protein BE20_00550 [Sorangium cellulosum]
MPVTRTTKGPATKRQSLWSTRPRSTETRAPLSFLISSMRSRAPAAARICVRSEKVMAAG